MPYSIEYRPTSARPAAPWAKIEKSTGKIVSRHRTKQKAEASVRAYYATKNCGCMVCNAKVMRRDPTRTTSIQLALMREIKKAFKNLQKDVKDFLVEQDALGLIDRPQNTFSGLLGNVEKRAYQFLTDDKKVEAFNSWFAQQVQANVLSPDPGGRLDTPWVTEYVESSYKRGMVNSYLSSKQGRLAGAGVGEGTQEEFLRSSFAAPEAMSKVKLLGTRAFGSLKGVTDAMATQMNRILAQGIADGSGADTIAREMLDSIGSLTQSRALTIARTEIINAHAEGQLDAFTKLGVEELGVKAEWSTAGDDRVCPECAELEGKIFTMDEARGMIPLHPNCRCAWIPAAPDEEKEDQAFAPVPDAPSWSPAMSADAAEEFAATGAFKGQDLFHFTSPSAVSSIEGSGFRVSDGIYGKGIYLTKDSTGNSIARDRASKQLKVAVSASKPLEVQGFGGLSRWMDRNTPGATEPMESLLSKGFDSLVVKFEDRPDYVVIFDKTKVTIKK